MPRKDNVKKNGSKNERASENRKYNADSPIQSPTANDIAEVMNPIVQKSGPGGFILSNMQGVNNYSDFVRNANVATKGWYSTLANGLPFIKDLHQSVLGRDSAEDYLKNNNMDWGDMEGYNDIKLLGRASSAINGLAQQGSTYLNNISSDLGKLYSGQKTEQVTQNGQ